jgi:transglutaminase/protease-like cytokinesis protein 3
MSHKRILRSLALLVAAVSFSSVRLAAQDAPSVAEAARRAREQKQASTKPVKVVDNDTLAPSHATDAASPSTSPQPGSSPAGAAPPAEDAAAPKAEKQPATDSSDDPKKNAETESLKQQIADQKQRVDLLQRQISLAQDSFISNPDHDHDKAGKDKLDSMRSDLQQMQADLADLQSKLTEAGGSGDSKPAAQPQP